MFLANMRRQVEEFKINCVRQLRMSTERLVELCQQCPKSVFYYLQSKYETLIRTEMQGEAAAFEHKHTADKNLKEEHLRLFRPNLENPANKEVTKELNEKEQQRCEEFKELIDDTQLNLLTAEEETSQLFHVAYLNNVRAMIAIFDKLIPRTDFIMLPGDEIVEKKHANIKMLTA
jgi:hypothetical protein